MFDGTLEKSAHPEPDRAAEAASPWRPRRSATVLAWAPLHGLALLTLAGHLNEELVRDGAREALAGRAAGLLAAGLGER
jgi:hypothetical protein